MKQSGCMLQAADWVAMQPWLGAAGSSVICLLRVPFCLGNARLALPASRTKSLRARVSSSSLLPNLCIGTNSLIWPAAIVASVSLHDWRCVLTKGAQPCDFVLARASEQWIGMRYLLLSQPAGFDPSTSRTMAVHC